MGDERDVKKGDGDDGKERTEANYKELIQRGLKPEAFKPFMYDLT
jgi:hypothetical protein